MLLNENLLCFLCLTWSISLIVLLVLMYLPPQRWEFFIAACIDLVGGFGILLCVGKVKDRDNEAREAWLGEESKV